MKNNGNGALYGWFVAKTADFVYFCHPYFT
jgi:hypothetical protein